jgi:hypothetical protein
MVKTRKHKKTFKGGDDETEKDKEDIKSGFPECTIMSQFPITNENVEKFQRVIKSKTDCFINTLQLFGLLDTVTANIFRIPKPLRTYFFPKEEIEQIFILLKGNNFTFKATDDFDVFANTIKTNLKPGNGVFAGYTGDYGEDIGYSGHVFILACNAEGNIYYIEPQLPVICEINSCIDLIKKPNFTYYLLFNSVEKLTDVQLRQVGFEL